MAWLFSELQRPLPDKVGFGQGSVRVVSLSVQQSKPHKKPYPQLFSPHFSPFAHSVSLSQSPCPSIQGFVLLQQFESVLLELQ